MDAYELDRVGNPAGAIDARVELELAALVPFLSDGGPGGLVRHRLLCCGVHARGLLLPHAGAVLLTCGHGYPPIGARGFAPQKTWVPSIPMRCTRMMLSTIDLAVAVPTPTGPPLAL